VASRARAAPLDLETGVNHQGDGKVASQGRVIIWVVNQRQITPIDSPISFELSVVLVFFQKLRKYYLCSK
jgi:hypothetical protein